MTGTGDETYRSNLNVAALIAERDRLKAALESKDEWISVNERLPECPHKLQSFVYSDWVLIAQFLKHEDRYAVACGVFDKPN